MKYLCEICNKFEYDTEEGDKDRNVEPGTEPKDFPEGWKCPICQADATHMKEI